MTHVKIYDRGSSGPLLFFLLAILFRRFHAFQYDILYSAFIIIPGDRGLMLVLHQIRTKVVSSLQFCSLLFSLSRWTWQMIVIRSLKCWYSINMFSNLRRLILRIIMSLLRYALFLISYISFDLYRVSGDTTGCKIVIGNSSIYIEKIATPYLLEGTFYIVTLFYL